MLLKAAQVSPLALAPANSAGPGLGKALETAEIVANQAAQHGLSLPLEKEKEGLGGNAPHEEQASRLRGAQRAVQSHFHASGHGFPH